MPIMFGVIVLGIDGARRTAPLALAIVHALQQAEVVVQATALLAHDAIQTHSVGCMIMILIQAELGLYRCTMDTICMQTRSSVLCQLHISLAARLANREGDLDMHGSDDLSVT
jgi:hypothetical protein